jgi:hypothetical protein
VVTVSNNCENMNKMLRVPTAARIRLRLGATFLAMFTVKVDLTECFLLEGCAPIAPNLDR